MKYQVISFSGKAAFDAQMANIEAPTQTPALDVDDRASAFVRANTLHKAGNWVALFVDGVLEKTYQHGVVIDSHDYH